MGVRPKASGKAKILVRTFGSHPGKATPYGVGRNEGFYFFTSFEVKK
jgi:hypothetical protein